MAAHLTEGGGEGGAQSFDGRCCRDLGEEHGEVQHGSRQQRAELGGVLQRPTAWRGRHVGARRRRRGVGLGLGQAQGGAAALLHGPAAVACWTVRGELRCGDEFFFAKKLRGRGGTARLTATKLRPCRQHNPEPALKPKMG
jgi:hypothetical protein